MQILDLALIVLVVFLAWRILQLYRSQPLRGPSLVPSGGWSRAPDSDGAQPLKAVAPTEVAAYERVDWISKAQIFAGIQMLDAKRKGLALVQEHNEECRLLGAIYLIGAAKSITLDMGGSEANAKDVAAFLIVHNLHMDRLDIEHAQLSVTRDETTLAAFRCGLEGGSNWLKHHFVPDEVSLFEAVTSSAFV